MATTEIVIEAEGPDREYWRDLWRYRELFLLLAWRNVTVHYKQTALGVAWAVVRPLATMLVFVLVFGKLARLPSGSVSYPLLVFCGMLPWQFFAAILSEASNSLVQNANLVSKVYFPRLLVPTTAVAVALVDLLVCVPILLGLLLYYGQPLTWGVLAVPAFLGLAMVAALGLGYWLCALNVAYRDVRYVLPFVLQFGLYLSPVGFSTSLVPEQYQAFYAVNPMVGVIEGVRWAVLGDQAFPAFALAVSSVTSVALLVSGVWYFRKTEQTFADVI